MLNMPKFLSKVLCKTTGHKWEGCKCTRCGEIRDEGHSFRQTEGKCEQICPVCGKVEKLPHQWENGVCTCCCATKGTSDKLQEFADKRLPFLHLETPENRKRFWASLGMVAMLLISIVMIVFGSKGYDEIPANTSPTSAQTDAAQEGTQEIANQAGEAQENLPPNGTQTAMTQTDPSTSQASLPPEQPSLPPEQASSEPATGVLPQDDLELAVYFIDVGQADSILLVCDKQTMLIDGGNAPDSNLIYSFLRSHGITHLDYLVASHAHEDHVGGLAGALNYATVSTVYCPVTSYDSKAFHSFLKYLGQQNVAITVPKPGETFMLGGAFVEILSPTKASDEPNNTSIVMKVTLGETSFLFTGDAEREEEQDILNAGYDLSATVLKVGHHGSDTSTTYPFLREIMPEYAVISCGTDNTYGHPHDNLLSRLRDAEVKVYRTDTQGDIICISDGKSVRFSTERNVDIETNPTIQQAPAAPSPSPALSPSPSAASSPSVGGGGGYIGNVNSNIFHKPSCTTLPAEHNRVYFDTRDEAIEYGHRPCKRCMP